MALSLAACGSSSSAEPAASSAPAVQTVTGTAQGKNGDVTVEVTLEGNKITAVTVTDQKETEGIADPALEKIPQRIVDANSVNVDTGAGATVTSEAIINAVKAAIESAGLNVDDFSAVQTASASATVETETFDTDLVVVGAGGAGMTAALRAKEDGVENVLVIEKMSSVGGATAMSSSSTLEVNTRTQTDEDSPEMALEDLLEVGNNKNDLVPVTMLATYSGKAVDWLADDEGVDYLPDTGSASAEYRAGRARMHSSHSGAGLVKDIESKLEAKGITIMLDTRAYELITDDNGKVTGVKAHDENKDYEINADAVLLATGGYCFDLDRIDPSIQKYPCSGSKANTGDGLKMVEPLNAELENMEYVAVAPHGIKKNGSAQHTKPQCLTAYETTGTILVNLEGKRIANEAGRDAVIADAMAADEDNGGREFMLMDQEAYDAYTSSAVERGYFTQEELDQWEKENGTGETVFAHGDTFADVAATVGMDADGLQKTFDAVQRYVKDGNDPDFGRTFTKALSTDGPYYLVEQCLRYSTTLGGVKINENLQVMNTDGQPIEGLYAAGEFVGGVFGEHFPARLKQQNVSADFVQKKKLKRYNVTILVTETVTQIVTIMQRLCHIFVTQR